MYKYILTGVDRASRYKVVRHLRTKKPNEVVFVLEVIYKKVAFLSTQRRFNAIMGQNLKVK